jgi:DNA-directed RNA polymerase subunit RPC12/RpoP
MPHLPRQGRQALKEYCIACGKELTRDEIGLHKKLVNRGATEYKCKPCLAAFFRITEEQCDEMIAHFRETGCTLFS